MKILCLAFATLVVLVAAACYPPTTSHPVGTTSGLKSDPGLVGLWKGGPRQAGERGVYFHFLPRLDGSVAAVMAQTGDQPDGDWSVFTLTTGHAGANSFMNAREFSNASMAEDYGKASAPDYRPPGTVPVLYRIDAKGLMTLYLMDENATKDAIKKGLIQGTIGEGSMGDARITADAGALDKFMATPAARALFVEPFITLKRVE